MALLIFFMNHFAGLIGGVWLLLYGEWKLVISAILITLISPYLLGLLMILSGFLIKPIIQLEERGYNAFSKILILLSLAWTYSIFATWCVIIFEGFFAYTPKYGIYSHLLIEYIPYSLIAYSVALSPIITLARADYYAGIFTSTLAALIFCVISIIVLVLGYIGLELKELIILYSFAVIFSLIYMRFIIFNSK